MKNIKLIIVFILGMLAMYGISNAYKLNASLVTYDKKNTTLESENVQGAIDELENDVINRKNQIIEALINKGANLDETANYDEIISGISSIESGSFGTHTFTKGEVLEIDTGLSNIKSFVLYTPISEKPFNELIYDISEPTKYRNAYDSNSSSDRHVNDVGYDDSTGKPFYSLLAINGGKVRVKAPEVIVTGCDWLSDMIWIAQ